MDHAHLLSFDNKKIDTLLVSRGKDNISTELEGETVLLNLASNEFVGLDAVGSSIWNLMERPITFQDLCKMLMDQYDVEGDVCRGDVMSFLQELVGDNLITVQQ